VELPIFPLNTVLFPGGTLPLHIFEERYKLLVQECVQEQRPFGVCLIRSGREVGEAAEQFEIGTTALITNVEPLNEGRLNIMCSGGERFRIGQIVRQAPYLVAEVDILRSTEDNDERTSDLAETAAALFAEYIRLQLAISNQWARAVETPSEPGPLSDFIAGRLAVDLRARQRLLEELSPKRRLEAETEILARLIGQLQQRVVVARASRWQSISALN
jgi:Lon protease-like protein